MFALLARTDPMHCRESHESTTYVELEQTQSGNIYINHFPFTTPPASRHQGSGSNVIFTGLQSSGYIMQFGPLCMCLPSQETALPERWR